MDGQAAHEEEDKLREAREREASNREYNDSAHPEFPKGFIYAIRTGDRAFVLEMLKDKAVTDSVLLGGALLIASNCGRCRPAPDPKRDEIEEIAKLLVDFSADVTLIGTSAANFAGTKESALMRFAGNGATALVELLVKRGADVNATDDRSTSLMKAALQGQMSTVQALLELNAIVGVTDGEGRTAADHAREGDHPMTYALLNPEGAKLNGQRLRDEFSAARLVHVLSTRYQKDPSQVDLPRSCDPLHSAAAIKFVLESEPLPEGTITFNDYLSDDSDPQDELEGEVAPKARYCLATGNEVTPEMEPQIAATSGKPVSKTVMAFNPNTDNAFLMEGDATSANAIWLRNWRERLEDARRTGGAVVQVLVPPGLSQMQLAEADMAADKGVPVVLVDCSNVRERLDEYDASGMPGIRRLKVLGTRVRRGETLRAPPSRSQLLELLEARRISVPGLAELRAEDSPESTLLCADLHPHHLTSNVRASNLCDVCASEGTHFRCTEGCDYDICNKCAHLLR